MAHVLDKFSYCPVCGSRHFTENNDKSKRCEDCGFVYYLNPSSATVALIENTHGEILVVRRAKEPAKGTLDLPGGFCDIGETAEEGIIREVEEETGLHASRVEYLFSIPNLYIYSGMTIPTMDMFFRCTVNDISGMHAMDDAAAAMWIKKEDINPEEFGLMSIRKGIAAFISAPCNT